MKKTKRETISTLICILVVSASIVRGQTPTSQRKTESSGHQITNLLAQARPGKRPAFSLMPFFTVTPMAAGPNLTVLGGGTLGRLTKWTGFTSSNSFIGDSTIFEDKYGMVGIGTDMPMAKLTVAGMIQSLSGGFLFPDGSVQTTSATGALFSVSHDATLTGNGTAASPLGVASGGVNTSQLADSAVTLSKIALNQVVTSLNNLTESITLAAGSNITITPSGNTLTIAGADGSNTAFQATSDQFRVLDPQGKDVISKQVPAGSYLIFFKVGLGNLDDSPQTASCWLSTGDKTTIRLGQAKGADEGVLVLQDAATFSAATTITVRCSGFQIGYFPAQDRLVLTAVKIGSIQ